MLISWSALGAQKKKTSPHISGKKTHQLEPCHKQNLVFGCSNHWIHPYFRGTWEGICFTSLYQPGRSTFHKWSLLDRPNSSKTRWWPSVVLRNHGRFLKSPQKRPELHFIPSDAEKNCTPSNKPVPFSKWILVKNYCSLSFFVKEGPFLSWAILVFRKGKKIRKREGPFCCSFSGTSGDLRWEFHSCVPNSWQVEVSGRIFKRPKIGKRSFTVGLELKDVPPQVEKSFNGLCVHQSLCA